MAGPINPHPEQKLLQPLDCGACEALFTEVLDHAEGIGSPLDPVQLTSFNAHVAGCAPCSGLLAEARRGHDWLRMLQQESVNPPADLLSRILAQTSGQTSGKSSGVTLSAPSRLDSALAIGISSSLAPLGETARLDFAVASATQSPLAAKPVAPRGSRPWDRVNLVAMARSTGRNVSEPRFLLTAAMAFFSITLTLNLLGVHVTQIRAADLKPGSLRRTVSRSYTDLTARVTRYYDNLRIVYELEARVREFRRNTDSLPEGPRKQEAKPTGGGPSSQRDNNTNRNDRLAGDHQNASPKRDEPEPARDADIREVALRHPQALHSNSTENLKSRVSYQRRFV